LQRFWCSSAVGSGEHGTVRSGLASGALLGGVGRCVAAVGPFWLAYGRGAFEVQLALFEVPAKDRLTSKAKLPNGMNLITSVNMGNTAVQG
jgi:hypothetical protein